jgi:hypothetical protein
VATRQRFTTRQLRELLMMKKINGDEQLIGDTGGVIPYVAFRNGFKKKNVLSAWQVLTPGRRTDPDGKYADGFNKTFLVSESGVLATPEQAKQWASEVYNVHDWVKTPYGSWTSKEHLDTRLRELLPEQFDPDYRDPTVQKIVAKLYGDDASERMFKVVVQLYAKPEPPLYVSATSEDEAHRQVTQLFVRVAGTRVLDGLKIHVNET